MTKQKIVPNIEGNRVGRRKTSRLYMACDSQLQQTVCLSSYELGATAVAASVFSTSIASGSAFCKALPINRLFPHIKQKLIWTKNYHNPSIWIQFTSDFCYQTEYLDMIPLFSFVTFSYRKGFSILTFGSKASNLLSLANIFPYNFFSFLLYSTCLCFKVLYSNLTSLKKRQC